MRKHLLALLLVLGWGAKSAYAGKVSGKTLDLEGQPLENVRIQAFAVSTAGVVDQVPFKTEFSKAGGVYEIDVGNTPRLILRYFRADRNDTLLPTPPTAITGGAISGLKDVTNLDVLIPELNSVPDYHNPYVCDYPPPQPHRLFSRLFRH